MTGPPRALGDEALRVFHLDDVSQGLTFVGCVAVIGFDDPEADPIAQIAGLRQSAGFTRGD